MKLKPTLFLSMMLTILPTVCHGVFPCTAKQSGDPPTYTVYRGKEPIFSPKSEGISKVVMSASGNYIALFASETAGIDVGSSGLAYSIAIVNCQTGKVKGYLKDGNVSWNDVRWHETTDGIWFDFKGQMSLTKGTLP